MPETAVIEIMTPGAAGADLAGLWNQDAELAALGKATGAGNAMAFPIDPASIGGAILIGTASGVLAGAIIEGVKALMTKADPGTEVEVKLVSDPSDPKVLHVKVTPKPG